MALLLLFPAFACAGHGAPEGAAGPPTLEAGIDASLLQQLAFRFTDPTGDGSGVYESTGPYRVVDVREHAFELVGFDPVNLRPTYTTLLLDGDQVWARVEIGDRSFLTRVR